MTTLIEDLREAQALVASGTSKEEAAQWLSDRQGPTNITPLCARRLLDRSTDEVAAQYRNVFDQAASNLAALKAAQG